jgi:hypothetical protein
MFSFLKAPSKIFIQVECLLSKSKNSVDVELMTKSFGMQRDEAKSSKKVLWYLFFSVFVW